MPVSVVCDSGVNAVLRDSLAATASSATTTAGCNNNNNAGDLLQSQIVSTTKQFVLKAIEYEEYLENYETQTDALKSKYIVLSGTGPSADPTNSHSNTNGTDKKVLGSQNFSNGNKDTSTAGPTPTLGTFSVKSPQNKGNELPQPRRIFFARERVQVGWKGGNRKWQIGSGMVNMGNTCYLNSTLQALFHVPAMANWLVSDDEHRKQCEEENGGQNSCIICAMSRTLLNSQSSPNPIKPWAVYSKLRLVCKHLVHGRQEDAHEFLRYLIEAMEKAYLLRFKVPSNLEQYSKETTPLNQILGGYLRSSVRCLSCNHLSITFQHFEDLLLDIRKAASIDDALQTYFARERLEDMGYNCESCKKKVSATKQFSLERPPAVLCIQLKRFTMQGTKLNNQVAIKPKLDLSPYVRRSNGQAQHLVYKLVAMVTHLGASQHCGHYTAIGLTESGNYYQFDDSSVRPISVQSVLQTNAYIIFYELESNPLPDRCQANNGNVTNGTNGQSMANGNGSMQMVASKENQCRPNGVVDKQGMGTHLTNTSSSYGFIGPVLPPNYKSSEKVNGQFKEQGSVLKDRSMSLGNNNVNGGSINVNNGSKGSSLLTSNGSGSGSSNGTATTPAKGEANSPKKYPSPEFLTKQSGAVSKLPSMPRLTEDADGDEDRDETETRNGNGSAKRLVPYDYEYTSDENSDNEDDGRRAAAITTMTGSAATESKTVATNGTSGQKGLPFVKTNSGIWKVYDTDEDDGGNVNKPSAANGGGLEKDEKPIKSKQISGGGGGIAGGQGNHQNGKGQSQVVAELLKSDHRGYGGVAVSTWSGQKSNMDKEIAEDKRLELKKRALERKSSGLDEEMDRGKVKKVKYSGQVGRDNPGFNPFQEYQSRQEQQPSWVRNGRGGLLFKQKFNKRYHNGGHHPHHKRPHMPHNRFHRNYNGFRANGNNNGRNNNGSSGGGNNRQFHGFKRNK